MTTVLADARLGLMVSDSVTTDGDRAWSSRKVHRIRGALVGFAGDVPYLHALLEWLRAGATGDFGGAWSEDSDALVLNASGLWLFDCNAPRLQRVPSGRESIGSGSVAAIAAYEALGWTDPKRAVRIACRHDINSRAPVRAYHL